VHGVSVGSGEYGGHPRVAYAAAATHDLVDRRAAKYLRNRRRICAAGFS